MLSDLCVKNKLLLDSINQQLAVKAKIPGSRQGKKLYWRRSCKGSNSPINSPAISPYSASNAGTKSKPSPTCSKAMMKQRATARQIEMSHAEPRTCARTALTQLNGHSQRCSNPFCDAVVKIKSPRGKHGRYCSTDCRMDGYVLRRAKALLNRVGIIRLDEL